MNPRACLPPDLHEATITTVAAGMSGAGVYRVESGDRAFALKISDPAEPVETWRRKLAIQQAAAAAELAPAILHTDESQRAVLSAFVVDRGFATWFLTPATQATALETLGRTLRRIHELPIPPGAPPSPEHALLAQLWTRLSPVRLPGFVAEAVARVTSEVVPDPGRALVLSHNDVNPTNLVFDGERLVILDWETAAPNDPFYDLAAISVFLRMDLPTCLQLLAAHDGVATEVLPARFAYDRRLVAVLCGVALLDLARQVGHEGDPSADSGGLADFYPRLRSGELDIRSVAGRWAFGLALVRESFGL